MKSNIGIIIQGPLITYGQGPNNKPEGFNSKDTILKNIENIRKSGFEYVVSTWTPQNENEKNILDDLLKENVVAVCNNVPDIFDPDHRHKQRVGILFGIQKLNQQKHIDYFVKIRTDMLMPGSFWVWVKEIILKKEGVLHVSHLMEIPFYMGDFIYAARKDIFIDFVNSIVKYEAKIFHPSIAFDDGVKYCQQKGCFEFQKDKFQKLYIFYIFSTRRNFINKLWNRFIDTNLKVLPEEIWNDIIWRERRIGSFLRSSNFKFDVSPLNSNHQSFKQAIEYLSDDYVRYWEKGNRNHAVVVTFRAFQKMLRFIYKIRYGLSRKLILWNPFAKKQIVLCRSACLGHTLFKLKNPDAKRTFLVCQQKTRLDLFLDHVPGRMSKPPRVKSEEVKKFLLRTDIYTLIQQQEKLPWLKVKKFDYMLIDSFSELTDQKFTHRKEGWSFFCHYTDIKHTAEFKEIFDCEGLLAIDNIEAVYTDFFCWFEKKFPGKKVVFFHYPTTLDERDFFKERGAEILRVMKNLEKTKQYVHNIYIDDSKVSWKETDKFPYHYSNGTNEEFLRKWVGSENTPQHS